MKKKLLFRLMILAFGAFLWMSHSGGRAASQNRGSTGAPGDGTSCSNSSCHGAAAINVDLDIAITDADANPVTTEYAPGETYTVTVTINNSGGGATPIAYGFQLVALTDLDEESTESFTNPGSNVQLATASSTGRLYAEHTGPSVNNNVFVVDWTAPTLGSGSVTFYAAGNGVNNDGTSNGDGGNETSFSLEEEEDTSMSVNEVAEKWELNLYPNPVVENIYLKGNSNFSGSYTATIVDVAGRAVASHQVVSEGGQMSIPSASLLTGNYTLMLQSEEEMAVIKFMKL